MSKNISSTDRSDMQHALWLARNIVHVCTSQPRCQAPATLQAAVDGWAQRVCDALNRLDIFRGTWESNALIQALDARYRWGINPADATFEYTVSPVSPALERDVLQAELERKLTTQFEDAKTNLDEARENLAAYRRATETMKRLLDSSSAMGLGSCGLKGEAQ